MRITLDNKLLIEYHELVCEGLLSKEAYNKARLRGKIKTTTRGGNGRVVEIIYDELEKRYQELIISKYGNPYEYIGKSVLKHHLNTDNKAVNFYMQYRLPDGKALPDERIWAYCRAAEWLNLLQKADESGRKWLKSIGFDSKETLINTAIDLIKAEKIDLPTNYSRLKGKLRKYKKQGYCCLISKKFGNNNSEKIGDVQKSYLRYMYANPEQPQKLLYSQITFLYNQEAAKRGWEAVTEQAIYNYLSQGSVQLLCSQMREASNQAKLNHTPVINRMAPSYANDMWGIDGTPMELYYQEGSALKRLYIFLTVDYASKKWIGVAFGESETKELVMESLKMACTMGNCLPYQIQSDHGSAIMACENQIKAIAKMYTPAGIGWARSKIIEPIQKHLNEQILKWYPNYAGAGITARKTDSHANAEKLKAMMKAGTMPNKEKVVAQIYEAMVWWNNRADGKGNIPSDVYQIASPRHRELSAEDRLMLFGVFRHQPNYYTNEGMALIVNNERRIYWVHDADFYVSHYREKLHIKYFPDDLTTIALYDNEHRFLAFAEQKELVPMARADWNDKASDAYSKMRDLQQQVQSKIDDQIERDLVLVNAKGYLKVPTSPNHRYKDRINQAEAELKQLMTVGYSPQPIVQDAGLYFTADDEFTEGRVIE